MGPGRGCWEPRPGVQACVEWPGLWVLGCADDSGVWRPFLGCYSGSSLGCHSNTSLSVEGASTAETTLDSFFGESCRGPLWRRPLMCPHPFIPRHFQSPQWSLRPEQSLLGTPLPPFIFFAIGRSWTLEPSRGSSCVWIVLLLFSWAGRRLVSPLPLSVTSCLIDLLNGHHLLICLLVRPYLSDNKPIKMPPSCRINAEGSL